MGSRREKLICHPGCTPQAVQSVYVDLEYRVEDRRLIHFNLGYEVNCDPDRVVMPGQPGDQIVADCPTDGLWQTTCFELFMGSRVHREYVECNFAGTGEWASYHFEAYRERVSPYRQKPRHMDWHRSSNAIVMNVAATFLPMAGPDTYLGLSAVIEEGEGAKSYWALAHPGAQPDFHHPDCFALRLGAPDKG